MGNMQATGTLVAHVEVRKALAVVFSASIIPY
jgi:hypothetical protein